MERHTVEYTFDGELVSSVTRESGTLTLYRTPEDTYFVHIDMRHIAEEDVARGIPPHAVLEVGCAPKGLPEDIIKAWWPDLLANQSRQ
jgi:hypothetical protein